MDLLEQGKKLAQDGHFEEALDDFVLALENDKENADIHFYLGLCYSSLEQFGYARYHYDLALKLKPNHAKTKLVYEGLKDVSPEKPPEHRTTRKAAAKARREQPEPEPKPEPETHFNDQFVPEPDRESAQSAGPETKVSEDAWEKAFPSDQILKSEEKTSGLTMLFLTLVGIALVALCVYFGLSFLS